MRRVHALHEVLAVIPMVLVLGVAACGPAEGGSAAQEPTPATQAKPGKMIRVPQDQPTIAAAMAAAGPGDMVRLAPGTYRETLALKAGVKVVGGPSTIDAAGLDNGMTADPSVKDASVSGIAVEKATLQGISLDGAEVRLRQVAARNSGYAGLLAGNGARLSLAECELSGNGGRGLNANFSDVSVEASRILDNGAAGIGMEGSTARISNSVLRGNGGAANVRVSYGSDARLDGNEIRDHEVGGVLLDDGLDPTDPRPPSARLSGNRVSGNAYGVEVQSGQLRSESDHLDGNWFGLYAHGPSAHVAFEGTTFDANGGYGIYATNGTGLTVEGGTVSHNGANGVHAQDVDLDCANDDCSMLRVVQGHTSVSLEGSRVEGNGWSGVGAQAGGWVSVRGCDVIGNGGPTGLDGIQAWSSFDYDLGDGVAQTIQVPGDITVRGSRIEGNAGWCGIAYFASSVDLGGAEGGGNSCLGNGGGVANATFDQRPIPARGNWWGTADGAAIAAMMFGPVDFLPFLTAAP